ncbi:hypothetical protein AB6F89_11470 [Providencia hangzhouensis]|uniref:hypothetical protein n=1 Tax=Providencia hangzhouensis TaxID=3031799 RepID=UPI0034DD6181
MKRALIRRNKTFLSEMLKSARMNTVSLSMMLDLCKQKTIFRMTDRLNNRGRLKENWLDAIFEVGFAVVPVLTYKDNFAYYQMFFEKDDLPQAYKNRWIDFIF